jgi:hypothetical protein
VLEVEVAPFPGDLKPAVGPERRKNVPAIHPSHMMRTNTHYIKSA